MVELGELEAHHADFGWRSARVVVVSLESREDAGETQVQFPHLVTVADSTGRLIAAAGVLHEYAGPYGSDIAAPTTILIDQTGTVRWLFRTDRYESRLSPEQLLAALARAMR
jgi:peroxiredoxin